jgi:hypothetical protein
VTVPLRQQMRFINLDITEVCNLRCHGCNHYVDSAPSRGAMTLGQVEHFVQESRALKWPWDEIIVMGGEPTAHPDFHAILDEVAKLRKMLPGLRLKVISNGIGERASYRLSKVKPAWHIHRSLDMKNQTRHEVIDGDRVNFIPEFGNVFLAPIDARRQIAACQIHATCGLVLTRYGYAPCACGGPRVLGWDIYKRSLSEVTEAWCEEQLKTLCAICGRNLNYCKLFKDDSSVSPFWRAALDSYTPENNIPLYPE